jgi:hypothetical protein
MVIHLIKKYPDIKPRVYHCYKSLSLNLGLSQLNPVHPFIPCFCKINFNVHVCLPRGLFPSRFPTERDILCMCHNP